MYRLVIVLLLITTMSHGSHIKLDQSITFDSSTLCFSGCKAGKLGAPGFACGVLRLVKAGQSPSRNRKSVRDATLPSEGRCIGVTTISFAPAVINDVMALVLTLLLTITSARCRLCRIMPAHRWLTHMAMM